MKKFKYKLAISGFPKDQDVLIPELERLGYKQGIEIGMRRDSYWSILKTCYDEVGRLGFFTTHVGEIEVNAKDKELVLTLAAMVDDEKYYLGELIVKKDGGFIKVEGCLAYINAESTSWRKATKEEIFKWYEDKHPKVSDPLVSYRYGFIDLSPELPEKWCVKRTPENADVINGWFNENFNLYLLSNKGYLHCSGDCNISQISNYTEITFEQFKRLVMKEEKKIIGYSLKGEYKKSEGLIIKALFMWEPPLKFRSYSLSKWDFSLNSDCYNAAIELGVLDLWFDPVYEEEKKEVILQIGNHRVLIKKGCDRIAVETGHDTTIDQWRSLVPPPITIGPWKANLMDGTYSIGCEKEVTFLEVNKVISTWEELNK